jgi:hypothetical protein
VTTRGLTFHSIQDFFRELLAAKTDMAACDFWEGKAPKFYRTNLTKGEIDLGAVLFKMDAVRENQLTFQGSARIAEEREKCPWADNEPTSTGSQLQKPSYSCSPIVLCWLAGYLQSIYHDLDFWFMMSVLRSTPHSHPVLIRKMLFEHW